MTASGPFVHRCSTCGEYWDARRNHQCKESASDNLQARLDRLVEHIATTRPAPTLTLTESESVAALTTLNKALEAEVAAVKAKLSEAAELISGLLDQQAMPDAPFNARCERFLASCS